MAKQELSPLAAILALNAIAAANNTEITVEGARADIKMTFTPKFVGIVLGDNNEIERSPAANTAFTNIQSTFITVEIDKAEGELPKLLKKSIYKNIAPKLYNKILDAGNAMIAAGGVFPEFVYTGEDIQVGNFHFETDFRIPNKSTKSGWSEDGQGNIVVTRTSPFIYFPDMETLETMLRRELRNKSARGEFVDSEIVQQINKNNPTTPPATKLLTPTAAQIQLYNEREASGAPQVADPNNPGYDIHAHVMKSA